MISLTPSELISGIGEPISINSFLAGPKDHNAIEEYMYSNLLKKSALNMSATYEEDTLRDFLDAEHRCLAYNVQFATLLNHPTFSVFLRNWRDEVHFILRDFKLRKPVITSGATSSVARGNTPLERFASAECTYELSRNMDLFPFPLPTEEWKLVQGSNLIIVPKTSVTGRIVCPEPAINGLAQSAIGSGLRQCLYQNGVDIYTVAHKHRIMAKMGSVDGSIVTDDLKWASALIYTSLCEYLLTPYVYKLCSVARSPWTTYRHPDGSIQDYHLQQFATMGNNFCFELETVIFLGLLKAACGRQFDPRISVCGDDLIYPQGNQTLIRKACKAVGFITNLEKSFDKGPFRESCGGDYLNGRYIRPCNWKVSSLEPADVTVMCNELRKTLLQLDFFPRKLWKLWYQLALSLDPKDRLAGPSHLQVLQGWPWRRAVKRTKSGKEIIKVWSKRPAEYTSFKEIMRNGDPNYFLRMASMGLVKGLGQNTSLTRLSVIKTIGERSICTYGPTDHSGKPLYTLVPKPGTKWIWSKEERQLFLYPSLSSSPDPLDVFTHLALTKCPSRIYAEDYIGAEMLDRVAERRKLFALLSGYLKQREALNSSLFDISPVDF